MAQRTPESLAFCTRNPLATTQHTVTSTRPGGVVVSLSPIASKVGKDILDNGGNAVDAAIATTFAIGVVSSYA
jgi:gamma-glutamyltranspeptidase/glutathione hydrolase